MIEGRRHGKLISGALEDDTRGAQKDSDQCVGSGSEGEKRSHGDHIIREATEKHTETGVSFISCPERGSETHKHSLLVFGAKKQNIIIVIIIIIFFFPLNFFRFLSGH